MAKTICKKKNLKKIDKPKFRCQKCKLEGRKKKEVCKPEKIVD